MSFSKKIGEKQFIGNRKIDSDEALGINFSEPKDMLLADIKIDSLENNPYQPRSSMDTQELIELRDSIEQNGLLQPIVVMPSPKNAKNFQIIAGHRRVEAHRMLNRPTIRAVIVKNADRDIRVDALIENIQRVNLSTVDEAFAVKELIELGGKKQVDVAKLLGKSKSYISQLLKITTLPKVILDELRSGVNIPFSVISQLSYIEDESVKIKIFRQIAAKAHTRDEVRDLLASISKKNGADLKNKAKPNKDNFIFKKRKNIISFRLDITDTSAKERAISELEKLLEELKSR